MDTETARTRRFDWVRFDRRWAVGGVLAVLLAGTAAGCGGSGGRSQSENHAARTSRQASSSATLVIENFAFHPAKLQVRAGSLVTVKNEDSTTHTVTAVSPHAGAFNTGDISGGSTASFHVPKTPATYPYICEIHQFMHGELEVTG